MTRHKAVKQILYNYTIKERKIYVRRYRKDHKKNNS